MRSCVCSRLSRPSSPSWGCCPSWGCHPSHAHHGGAPCTRERGPAAHQHVHPVTLAASHWHQESRPMCAAWLAYCEAVSRDPSMCITECCEWQHMCCMTDRICCSLAATPYLEGAALVADLLRLEVLVALVTVCWGLLQAHSGQVSCRGCCHMPTGMSKPCCSQSRCAEAGYTPIKLTTVAIEAAIEQPDEAGQSLTGAYLL